ncbi:hypothetical protein CTI12_AA194770 [Artemisia annua]|uniref:Helitron helicase-like domain-containing protein n=1 Tax=Artemisia annua TaxID=35608 RepID=A0A2U1MCH5_ARTAN|nr:hypothetical protein CTI12_AA194770 [Artemisia annua]
MKMHEDPWNQTSGSDILGDYMSELPSSSGIRITQLPVVEVGPAMCRGPVVLDFATGTLRNAADGVGPEAFRLGPPPVDPDTVPVPSRVSRELVVQHSTTKTRVPSVANTGGAATVVHGPEVVHCCVPNTGGVGQCTAVPDSCGLREAPANRHSLGWGNTSTDADVLPPLYTAPLHIQRQWLSHAIIQSIRCFLIEFQILVSSFDVVVLTVAFHIVTLVGVAGTSALPAGHDGLGEHRSAQPSSQPTTAARLNVRTPVREDRLTNSMRRSGPLYNRCCHGGRVRLFSPRDYPIYIKQLFSDNHFMNNIRAYNQMFAMTSLGANIDDSVNVGRGPMNCQTADYIGAIVFEDGPQTESKFDIVIESHSGEPERVNKLHPCYMAFQLPLLFIFGEQGYHTGLRLLDVNGTDIDEDKRVTMNAYYAY